MSVEQWKVAKRTTAVSVAGVLILAAAVLLTVLGLLHRLGDDAGRLAREKIELAAITASAEFLRGIETLRAGAIDAVQIGAGRGVEAEEALTRFVAERPKVLSIEPVSTIEGVEGPSFADLLGDDGDDSASLGSEASLPGVGWIEFDAAGQRHRLRFDAPGLLAREKLRTQTAARYAFVASIDEPEWVVPAGAAGGITEALADEIALSGVGGETESRVLVVGGERFDVASAEVDSGSLTTRLAVVLAVPSGSDWGVTALQRGRLIAIGLVAVLLVWSVGFLTALGAHGARPRSETGGEANAADEDPQGATMTAKADLPEWAVLCVTVRLRSGSRTAGLTLDDAPDELSAIIDGVINEAQSRGLQLRGRMPDRVVLVDFGERGEVGKAAMDVALRSVRRAVEEVRSNAYDLTAGVAAGAFDDDSEVGSDDDQAWGGRSLALAEALASTGQANAVLVGERVAAGLGSTYVFREPAAYWVQGVGDVVIYRAEDRR